MISLPSHKPALRKYFLSQLTSSRDEVFVQGDDHNGRHLPGSTPAAFGASDNILPHFRSGQNTEKSLSHLKLFII